ncbi:hypothetical protein H0H93_010802 [Arthromyces matolae]|nr:hypothetical protein H0H93_010802 [Arthromyces matolae]
MHLITTWRSGKGYRARFKSPSSTDSLSSPNTDLRRPNLPTCCSWIQIIKLLYPAIDRDTKKKLVLKFASKYMYSSAAPHLLSEHNLAPTLHYPSKDDNGSVKYGGRHMIVMDYVEMKPLSGTLSIAQSKEVRRSIDLLHENNFVFGDLRPPNILIEGDKAMLVDFDWCGEDGKAHYPADLNTFMGIDWHPDVGPDAFMAKEAKYKSPNYLIRWFYKDVQDLKHMCYGSWNDVHRGHRKVASMPLSGKACVMYGRRTVQVLEAFSTKTGEILMDNIQRRQPL